MAHLALSSRGQGVGDLLRLTEHRQRLRRCLTDPASCGSPRGQTRSADCQLDPGKHHLVEPLAQSCAGIPSTPIPFDRIIQMQNQRRFKLSSFLASSTIPSPKTVIVAET